MCNHKHSREDCMDCWCPPNRVAEAKDKNKTRNSKLKDLVYSFVVAAMDNKNLHWQSELPGYDVTPAELEDAAALLKAKQKAFEDFVETME